MRRVVVLGGGYAGLAFVQGLRRAKLADVEITLVDRYPFHTLLTETHTVAAGSRPVRLVKVPLRLLQPGVELVTARVTGIDTAQHQVLTDAAVVPYDILAFCLGGIDNDFDIPGVREHALFLRGPRDAERIRARLKHLATQDGVVIVGGGLTGVELAAEMAMHGKHRRITVVESHHSLVNGLPAALQERARRRLGWLGVNVLTGTRVEQVAPDRVHIADGSILMAAMVVWATGVKGHPLVPELGVTVDHLGRALVSPDLQTDLAGIYVLGDSAVCRPAPELPALPHSAQLAEQMGFAAAANVAAQLQGQPARIFHPHMRGILCDLGGLNASGLVYRFQIHGLLGALAKGVAVHGHLWRTMGATGWLRHLRDQVQHAWRGDAQQADG